jgi:hypothetical protein
MVQLLPYRIQSVSIIRTYRLNAFREITAVYCGISTSHINFSASKVLSAEAGSMCVTSGFRRDADEIFWGITQRRVVILYRRFRTTYRSHLQGSRSLRMVPFLDFLTLEDGTDTLSRNVGKGSQLEAALQPRRSQMSGGTCFN